MARAPVPVLALDRDAGVRAFEVPARPAAAAAALPRGG